MAIPSFQDLMLPFLKNCVNGNEYTVIEMSDIIAKQLNLSSEMLNEIMSSGQTKLVNRIAWVKSYLGKAGLIIFPSRGKFKITPRGLDLINSSPNKIDIQVLKQYPEFIEWQNKSKSFENSIEKTNNTSEELESSTPEEQIDTIYKALRKELSIQLLEVILKNPPSFFEQLVVDLLVAMGYGGSRQDAGLALGGTGDGGIDGIIKEDRLGLDIIYIQAKRYAIDNSVPSREVRDFVGSLEGNGAQKGVMITTSSFTRDGLDFVKKLQQKKIVLIDGERLTNLMIDFGVGVSKVNSYEIKKINLDYFENY
ncbi:MAG: restriction endonuclease [Neisseriaceae bacterium]|nr:MAG: restriction endonuclease [Neisseriaceae bacterium]